MGVAENKGTLFGGPFKGILFYSPTKGKQDFYLDPIRNAQNRDWGLRVSTQTPKP